MPFGATPSRWCVCQFHHFRTLQTDLVSVICNRVQRPYTRRLGQKRVAKSMRSGIPIDPNLITGKLFPETPHFRLEYPWLQFPVRMAGPAEYAPTF